MSEDTMLATIIQAGSSAVCMCLYIYYVYVYIIFGDIDRRLSAWGQNCINDKSVVERVETAILVCRFGQRSGLCMSGPTGVNQAREFTQARYHAGLFSKH